VGPETGSDAVLAAFANLSRVVGYTDCILGVAANFGEWHQIP